MSATTTAVSATGFVAGLIAAKEKGTANSATTVAAASAMVAVQKGFSVTTSTYSISWIDKSVVEIKGINGTNFPEFLEDIGSKTTAAQRKGLTKLQIEILHANNLPTIEHTQALMDLFPDRIVTYITLPPTSSKAWKWYLPYGAQIHYSYTGNESKDDSK